MYLKLRKPDQYKFLNLLKRLKVKKVTPALRDANKRRNKIGLGGRNQSVKIYTTKRQKSRV